MFKFRSSQSKFRILAKVKGQILFLDFNSEKEMNRWLDDSSSLVDEEIQIFQRDEAAYRDISPYRLIYSESKRKVGF